jgi:hypothetical protein
MTGFSIVVAKTSTPELGTRLFIGRQWPDDPYPEGCSHWIGPSENELKHALRDFDGQLTYLRTWTRDAR